MATDEVVDAVSLCMPEQTVCILAKAQMEGINIIGIAMLRASIPSMLEYLKGSTACIFINHHSMSISWFV